MNIRENKTGRPSIPAQGGEVFASDTRAVFLEEESATADSRLNAYPRQSHEVLHPNKSRVVKVALVAIALLATAGTLYAWSAPPSGSPPTCPAGSPGCDAPVNVSNTFQLKEGNLMLNYPASGPAATIGLNTNGNLLVPFGNVGIGTAAPQTKLQIKSNATIAGGLSLENNSTAIDFFALWLDASQKTRMQVYNGATWLDALTIDDANGNVGIGTTNPGYKLDVAGDVNANCFRVAGGTCLAAGGGGTVTSLTAGAGITMTPASPITTTGTIAADTTYLQRRVSGTCAAGSSIRVVAEDGTVTCETDDSGGGGTVTAVTGTGNIASTGGTTPNITFTGILPIANGGTNIGTIGGAGSVIYSNGTQHASTGVGLAGQVLTSAAGGTPTWQTPAAGSNYWTFAGTHIYNNTGTIVRVDNADTNNGTPDILFGGAGSGEGIGSKRTAGGNQFGLDFYTQGGTNRMSIAVGGNVGIGTTNPGASLHVSASLTSEIRLTATGVAGADWGILPQTGNTTPVFRIYDRSKSLDRLSIDTNGNVGIGTTGPTQKLEVTNGNVLVNGGTLNISSSASGQTATQLYSYSSADSLWLLQPTSPELYLSDAVDYDRGITMRYTPGTTGAIAGQLVIGQTGKNNVNFTHGITSLYTNGQERLRIDSSGNVGIGTAVPGAKLHVAGNIIADGSVTAAALYYSSSDATLKQNIRTVPNALSDVLKLRGVKFDWKKDGTASVGVIAQELEQVYPELVRTDPTTGLKSVGYANLVGPLIEAVKELKAENDDLRARIEKLEQQN